VWRQTSADMFASTLGFSRKRSRNEYEDIVATNFETLQQSRNRIHIMSVKFFWFLYTKNDERRSDERNELRHLFFLCIISRPQINVVKWRDTQQRCVCNSFLLFFVSRYVFRVQENLYTKWPRTWISIEPTIFFIYYYLPSSRRHRKTMSPYSLLFFPMYSRIRYRRLHLSVKICGFRICILLFCWPYIKKMKLYQQLTTTSTTTSGGKKQIPYGTFHFHIIIVLWRQFVFHCTANQFQFSIFLIAL